MRQSFAPLAFALGSTALVIRGDQQCVQLKASGGVSGTLGQLSDGQNRVGGNYPAACYCLSNGGFTDSSGRGCILTPPTTQFQCDVGASPTTGFSIGSSGSVTYNGNTKFYACPATGSEYNVYTQPVSGQTKCVEITLSAGDSCGASKPPPPPPAPSCPKDLSGSYQFPHLIVPISSSSPNMAYGTSYFGKADKDTCSIFNFDIPPSYSGQTCTVVFLFPNQSQLQTSSYTVSGSGGLDFSSCSSAATQSTTWNSKPSCSQVSHIDAAPGNSYMVATGSCKAGQTVAYEMCAGGDYSLNYFQDYNPSPIGLYIRAC